MISVGDGTFDKAPKVNQQRFYQVYGNFMNIFCQVRFCKYCCDKENLEKMDLILSENNYQFLCSSGLCRGWCWADISASCVSACRKKLWQPTPRSSSSIG